MQVMDKPIVEFDNDDFILGMGELKKRYMVDHFSGKYDIEDIKPYNCSRSDLVPIIGLEDYVEMNNSVKELGSTLQMPPLEGALEGIQELSELFRILVLSARTPEETEHVKVRLEQLGFLKYIDADDINSSEDPRYDNIEEVTGVKKVDVALSHGARIFGDDDVRWMPKGPVVGLQCLLYRRGEDEEVKEYLEKHDVGPHIIVPRNWRQIVDHTQRLAPFQPQ